MKRQLQLSAFAFTFFLFGWVDCASVPSCASMRSWFPGTPPASFADNLPYQLIVTGYVPKGENVPVFTPESSHTGKIKNYQRMFNWCNVYEMIHIWTADGYESDKLSSQWISNLSNWNKEAWKKKFRASTGSPEFFSGFFIPIA